MIWLPKEELMISLVSSNTSYQLGIVGGGYFAYLARGVQKDNQRFNRLFRKPWMKVPWHACTFIFGYAFASQLVARTFNQRSVNFERTHGEMDLVSRFRYFEQETDNPLLPTHRDEIVNYLSSATPLSKTQMLEELGSKIANSDEFKKLRIKRLGKDLDDIYYAYAKIHGLENIAFVDPKDLEAAQGNPIEI